MNQVLRRSFSVLLTLVVLAAALVVFKHLWQYYMYDPWTRDAHVVADVVQVAPDVSGLVSDVQVQDNATVHKGDVLFVIDQARYRIAVEQAEGSLQRSQAGQARSQATLERNQATLEQLQREALRDSKLHDLVATEEIESRRSRVTEATAGVTDAKAGVAEALAEIASASAALDKARLDLERSVVRSPVDGRVNDRLVRVGDYVSAGRAAFAILDTGTLRVDGYFEETRLPSIHVGDPVKIYLMGERGALRGHVDSIAAGVEDRYRTAGSNLLPNITPAFDWVRLAQRVPVRIRFDDLPEGVQLVAGRTATVSVVTGKEQKQDQPAKVQAKPL